MSYSQESSWDAHYRQHQPSYHSDYSQQQMYDNYYTQPRRNDRLYDERAPPSLEESEVSDLGGYEVYDDMLQMQNNRNRRPEIPPMQHSPCQRTSIFQKEAGLDRDKSDKIEIAPGVRMTLRGAKETWQAVERDFYMPCECFGCQSTIFCIQDAEFVICPLCSSVSPLDNGAAGQGGGAGLGFTMEDLARWQEEIYMNQQRYRAQRHHY